MNCEYILVIEDNDDIRETLEDTLKIEGYEVLGAKDGEEGLATLRTQGRPALIFLDLMMPIMSGWEFLDALATKPTYAMHRVVTLSAVPATASLNDKTPLKTAGSLTKPIDIEQLLDQARRFCGEPGVNKVEIAI